MSPATPPGRILELSIAQEFYDERLFADLAPSYKIISQGKIADNVDFNQWWDKYEGDQHLLLNGKTMADWETELMQSVFPDKADIYARFCGGWRFSTYLRQRPSASSTKAPTGASPSATSSGATP